MGSDSDASPMEDEGLSGFIEEDSINAIAPDLPAEFSMNTYQDLMHHFKIICQLFVHLAVQDPEDRQSFMEQSLKGINVLCLTEYDAHCAFRPIFLCTITDCTT